jgi:hypothetical protein
LLVWTTVCHFCSPKDPFISNEVIYALDEDGDSIPKLDEHNSAKNEHLTVNSEVIPTRGEIKDDDDNDDIGKAHPR